jgi:lysine/ornithine N-monooxygenase
LDKSIRKKLRELADIAYERELGQHLSKLYNEFVAWRSGKISSHELADRVHQYHNGQLHDAYILFTDSKPDIVVAKALSMGIMTEDEVPDDVRKAIARSIEAFRMMDEADKTG